MSFRRIVDNAEAQHQILAEWERRPADERNRTNSWSGVEMVQHGAPRSTNMGICFPAQNSS
jgi:hypothetical protein